MNFRIKLNSFGRGIKAHSPEILLVSGLVEGAVGTVLACRATRTRTMTPILVKEYRKKRSQKEKIADAIDICKLYAPAAGFMVASATSICASHGIMRKRYAGLVAAYGTLTSSFLEYRERVKKEIGEKREEELFYGLEKESVPVVSIDKDGKERKVNKKLDVRRKNGLSPYSQLLDPEDALGRNCSDPFYVDSTLVTTENWMNDRLRSEGHVYLNDIRKELGLATDDVGQLVGWIYDPQRVKDGNGDNQIRIIRKDIRVPREDGGFDLEIWLDFNVDGVIFGKMSQKEYNTHIQEPGDQGIEFSNKEE